MASRSHPADCTISLGSCRAACSISLTILGVVCVNISGSVRQVEVSGIMSRTKVAALLLLAFACLCSISAAQEQQPPDTLAKSTAPVDLKPAQPANADLAANVALSASDSNSHEYVRSVPLPRAVTGPDDIRPFRSVAIGFKADTLGAGIEIATPMSRNFNLRTSYNFFAFNDGFNYDGLNYDARLHLKSSETMIDWFPIGVIHLSTGVLWVKNSMTAPVSVPPGQTFTLGGQSFLNSVDDPIAGTSSATYPHSFAPLVLVGLGNIIPRSGRHLTFPFEIGGAYTGSPQLNLNLSGTICTTDGCVNLVQNTEAADSLKQEIKNLNKNLSSYPVFPIVSMGVAYHF